MNAMAFVLCYVLLRKLGKAFITEKPEKKAASERLVKDHAI